MAAAPPEDPSNCEFDEENLKITTKDGTTIILHPATLTVARCQDKCDITCTTTPCEFMVNNFVSDAYTATNLYTYLGKVTHPTKAEILTNRGKMRRLLTSQVGIMVKHATEVKPFEPGDSASAGYYNSYSFENRYQPFDDHMYHHNKPLIRGQYHDASGSESSLVIGGVVGASSVVIIMLIFCLGLAFGMLIYCGYSQKRELERKGRKEAMHWIEDENRNDV
eukprot:74506_1